MKKSDLIIVRGAGDLATGTIHRLKKSGFPLLILETDHPDTLEPVQPTIQQTIVSLLSLQSDSSMALSSEVASFTKEDIAVLKGFSTSYQKAIASSQSSASTCAIDSQHVDLFSRDTPMGIFLRVSNHYLLQRSI